MTHLGRKTNDVRLVQKLAQHSDIKTTMLYLECSPKPDPCVMRVQRPELGERTFDERQEAFSRADHQETA
ncbi:MAG: hypothetical protein JNM18_09340 [Planctomycetaceae bacterium]|nr:hypothetical protein [Planctomycetaceae bacterium]